MIRRFGTPPDPSQRYTRRAGVYAILPMNDGILATFQAAPHDEFQLPGGGVDPGESPLVALHREVMEETGWSIAAPRRIGAFRRFTYMPEYKLWAEKLCTIYVAHPARRIGPPTEPGHTAVWLDVKTALSELAASGDRHFVQQWFFP
ncbi:NUDIX hydrolase [Arenibacterium halophilum]|uniref:NUDIX hydrolase n=1 Tax=Arenibacterium halophilum TaxID=2583821 RepID=A0ABY2X5K0_9RHOB|nr:NUDIX hydrolase [Arenibacterium halophilum]TMV10729.1 NUDIX hydrolase [Arenibacterium halophilum]